MDQDDLGNVGLNPEGNSQLPSQLNFSDLIDAVLQGDPAARPIFEENSQQQQQEAVKIKPNPVRSSVPSIFNDPITMPPNAYLEILVQPQAKGLRYRYECEGRSAGSIPGVGSTPENKTSPTIKVCNYQGPITIVVSLVTKDQPYRPHPHNLVGKGCSKGVYTLKLNNDSMIATFGNLGIQCVKKKDIEKALKIRHDLRIDPFRTRFDHRHQPSSIDLNCVRLCFQAFIPTETIENNERKIIHVPIDPIVSDLIYDKKAMSDLMICRLSKPSGSVEGDELIILLCEKVTKEDIQVRFFEGNQDSPVWEALANFQSTDVHKQVAISFKTPKYRRDTLEDKAKCFIQLRRPSDGELSEPIPFEYYNPNRGPKRKLPKMSEFNYQGSCAIQQLLSPNQQEIKREPHSPNRHAIQYPTAPSPNQYTPQQNLAGIPSYTPQPDYIYSGNSSGINEILLDLYKPNTNPVIGESNLADAGIVRSTSTAVGPVGTTMPGTLSDAMNQLDQSVNTQNPLDNNSYIMNISSSFLNAADQLSTSFLNFLDDPTQGTQQGQQAQPDQQVQLGQNDEENMSGSFLRMNLQ